MTADETPAHGDEPTTVTAGPDHADDPGGGGGRARSEAADQRRGDEAGGLAATPVVAIGPAIRDVAARLGRIELALTAWGAPLEGADDEGRAPAMAPGVQTVLARLDEQAAAAERHDEAFAGALRDLVDQLNEFAGIVGEAGAGPARAETLSATVTERLLDGVLPPIQALETTVTRRLAVIEALVASAATAARRDDPDGDPTRRVAALETAAPNTATPEPGVAERLALLAEEVAELRTTAATRTAMTTVHDGVEALVLRPDPLPALAERLDAMAMAVAALGARPSAASPTAPGDAARPVGLDVATVSATVEAATTRALGALRHQLDQVAADVAAARTAAPSAEVLERLDRLGSALQEVRTSPPPTVLERLERLAAAVDDTRAARATADDRLGLVAEGVAALREAVPPDPGPRLDEIAGAAGALTARVAELLDVVRDDVVPLGATLPAALARLEVELTVVGERTAEATAVARDAGTATERLRTDVGSTLAAVERLAPPGDDDGGIGAALGRLEARAAEQARLVVAVHETVADLARSAPAEVDALERTVVADLDAVGEQLDAVGRVLQQLVGTLAVVEAGTIGVTPRAERSRTAAQAALADLRAARRR